MVSVYDPPLVHNLIGARRSIDAVLADARRRLTRLSPREAFDAVAEGAILVDIRPDENREVEGGIPGALIIHRNVLEWRLDPSSDARVRQADYNLHVIVFCNEGYTSSLAAAALLDLGVHRATDLAGGYRAWRAAGLPNSRSSR
jgi:rhodanese-related sulfurtransferase